MTAHAHNHDDELFGWYDDCNGTVHYYPNTEHFIDRDTGQYRPDEVIYNVIEDVALLLITLTDDTTAIRKARENADEARGIYTAILEDEDEDDPDLFENLMWCLKTAENLPGVYVDWCGDIGSVTTTLVDAWRERPVCTLCDEDENLRQD